MTDISTIIDFARHPISDTAYGATCRAALDRDGALVLPGFVRAAALATMQDEAEAGRDAAYFCTTTHSVYLTPPDPDLPPTHPVNRQVVSSKGCICDDVVPQTSPLRALYDAPSFRDFICQVTGETAVHPYADPLSSINIHYAERGQELGWHFDNSSFAITLLLQEPGAGGQFEYRKDFRDADAGDMNHDGVTGLLDGTIAPHVLEFVPGDLVLFRGRNSIHRVAPNESDQTRMLAVLAYNAEPGTSLSDSARMTFYGRLS